MLKFSGFAGLTSCLGGRARRASPANASHGRASSGASGAWYVAGRGSILNAARARGAEAPWRAATHSSDATRRVEVLPADGGIDTEAGMLSGISRKRSLRSSLY